MRSDMIHRMEQKDPWAEHRARKEAAKAAQDRKARARAAKINERIEMRRRLAWAELVEKLHLDDPRYDLPPDTFIQLQLPDPDTGGLFGEDLAADHIRSLEGGEEYLVLETSKYVPLAPGDYVRGVNGVIQDITEPAEVWMVRAHFLDGLMPADPADGPLPVVREVVDEWSVEASVTQLSPVSFVVVHTARGWITRHVGRNLMVERIELLRNPNAEFDFEEACRTWWQAREGL